MSIKTNDQLMTIYISSLIRAITAFHDLIDNKIQNRQQQEEREGKKDEGKDEKGSVTNNEKKADNEGNDTGKSGEDQEGSKDKGKRKS